MTTPHDATRLAFEKWALANVGGYRAIRWEDDQPFAQVSGHVMDYERNVSDRYDPFRAGWQAALASARAERGEGGEAWKVRSVLGNNGPGLCKVHLLYGIGDEFTQHEQDVVLNDGDRIVILTDRQHDALVYGGVVPLSEVAKARGEERERCAVLAEQTHQCGMGPVCSALSTCQQIAEAIRAPGPGGDTPTVAPSP